MKTIFIGYIRDYIVVQSYRDYGSPSSAFDSALGTNNFETIDISPGGMIILGILVFIGFLIYNYNDSKKQK